MRSSSSKGYNKIQKGTSYGLWLNTGDSEGIDAEGLSGKKVVIDINQTEVLGVQPTSGSKLTIALREVDYCDEDGNQYKMLVLCSEPYSS